VEALLKAPESPVTPLLAENVDKEETKAVQAGVKSAVSLRVHTETGVGLPFTVQDTSALDCHGAPRSKAVPEAEGFEEEDLEGAEVGVEVALVVAALDVEGATLEGHPLAGSLLGAG
jgi:hypothetical protein